MALKETIAVLGQIPFFAALGPEPLRLVAFSAESLVLREGEVLFRKGETSDAGYVVMSGIVVLRGESEDEPATLAGSGTLLGEIALIVDTVRPATATVRDAANVLRIPRIMVHRVLEEFPETPAAIRRLMLKRVDATSAGLAGIRYDLIAIDREEARQRGSS